MGERQNAGELWSNVLGELKLKLARATFDTWLRNSVGLRWDGRKLIVGLKNAYAVEWCESRLLRLIERTASRVAECATEVGFQVIGEAVDTQIPTQGEGAGGYTSAEALSPMFIELVEFDPLKKGFVQTSAYAWQFWQPYLGRGPFALWQVIRSFAWNVSHGYGGWPGLDRLAAHCCTDRQTLTGRSRGTKWQTGWLEILEREGVVWYEQREDGRYAFKALASLPLLTEQQVRKLPKLLQKAHRQWLERCELDLETWEQLRAPTLAGVRRAPGEDAPS